MPKINPSDPNSWPIGYDRDEMGRLFSPQILRSAVSRAVAVSSPLFQPEWADDETRSGFVTHYQEA